MTKIIGRQFQFGIGKETTRGTIVSPGYWLPYQDLNIDEKQDKIFDVQAYGIIEDAISALTTKKLVEGSVSALIGDQSFGLILYSLFGTLTTHAAHPGESAVYDNIFNVAETVQHQSLTLAIHDPASGQDYAHPNAVVSKLELDYVLKEFVKFTATLRGQVGTAESAYTPSTTTENHFVPQYLTFNIAGTYPGVRNQVYSGTGTAASTTAVTALSFDARLLEVGMTVLGTNIPGGTTISAIVSATALTLSQASTGNASDLTFGWLTATGTASTTIHVTGLTGLTTASLRVGQTVVGPNVPAGATIATIVSSTAFDLSAATTGAAGNLAFGPAVIKTKSVKLTIDENVEDQEVLGNLSPADFLNKEFKVEGMAEIIWQNETDAKTAFLANTSQAIQLDLKNTDVTIGSAANPEVRIDLTKCYITELGRPLKVKDLVYQTIKFRSVYSISDSLMVKARLTNTVNGY